MISWGQILYGAGLSTVLAAVALVAVRRECTIRVLGPGLAAAFLGPLAWNAILHRAANGTRPASGDFDGSRWTDRKGFAAGPQSTFSPAPPVATTTFRTPDKGI